MSEIKTDKLTGVGAADNITVTDGATTFKMQSGLNKMWISYEGIANSIFDSLNVGSVTDVSTGQYRYNFSNNFNVAESYSSAMSVVTQSSPYMGSYTLHDNALTSSIEVRPARNTSGSQLDVNNTTMNCCGDLA
tara:strand:+ start:561 stop:962 length:402 start_codon:yes stop_codon:yes gene_type:complete